MIWVSGIMFLISGLCMARAIVRDESEASIAAGVFAVAACVALSRI